MPAVSAARKRAGQLLSKGRYISAQALAYLKDDLWLKNAALANNLAQKLAIGFQKSNQVHISNPVQANEVFATMPRALFDKLIAAGANFYEWPIDGLADHEIHTRFVLSWATPEYNVVEFLKLVQEFS